METKKSSKADLTKYRSLIFGLSFLITLSFIITAFEWKSYGDGRIVFTESSFVTFDPLLDVPPTVIPPPKPVQTLPVFIETPNDEEIEKEVTIDIDPNINREASPIKISIAPEPENKPDIFDVVEESAAPNGGIGVFYKYVAGKIKYPSQARRMGVEGRVFVEFVINPKKPLDFFAQSADD